MAIVLDSVTNGVLAAGGAGATLTVAHTCSAATKLLVVALVASDSNQTAHQTSSVTYNGVSMTNLVIADNLTEQRAEFWYLLNPTTGSSQNIVASVAFCNYVGLGAISFEGTSTSAPTISNKTTNTTGSAPTTSVTTTTANSWLLDVICSQSVETVGSGQTLDWQNANQSFQNGAGSHKAATTTGSYSMTWANTGGNGVAHAVMVIEPAASSGATVSNLGLLGIG